MRKPLIALVVSLVGLFTLAIAAPLPVMAVDVTSACNSSASKTDACKSIDYGASSSENPVISVISLAIDVISIVIGIMAVIIIIISAIRLVASRGDSQAVAKARGGIVYSLIAIAVAALANVIVGYVLTKIG